MNYKRLIYLTLIAVCLFSFGYANENKLPLSNVATVLSEDGNSLYMAQKSQKSLEQRLLKDGKVIQKWNFKNSPTGLTRYKNKLIVTTSYDIGNVVVIDTKSNNVVAEIKTQMGACSPIVNKAGTRVFICNQFTNAVTEIDLESKKVLNVTKVVREPRKATLGKDEKYLYVANFLPSGRADLEVVAADVSVIDAKTFKLIKNIKLENGSNALRGICLSPEGKYVFVSHNLGRFQVPTSQLHQGWMNTSGVSIIETATNEFLGTVLFDEPEHGAAGIWGIQCDHNKLIVSHSGTHDVSVVDYKPFIEKFEKYSDKKELAYDLQFLQGLRQRIKVQGNGPRDFIYDGEKIIVPTFFTDQVNIINLTTKQNNLLSLNPGYEPTIERLGEQYFNDASLCFQEWQSCNGCHPGDGRTDGLNWDLLNDGIGNPKNCKSMLYSHVTPPAMITGIRPDAETAVRAGFVHIQFAQVSEDHKIAVDEYLKSLRPLPSPYLVDGKLSDKALRGKEVYEKLNCDYCHTGPYHTDLKKHKIGTGEFEEGWDTPTLAEVWRTAPYLNNGSMNTLKDLFTIDKHGVKGAEVEESEISDLIEYVNSL
jgi:DNA-binding beta-propeller fold protein YncE